MRRREFIGLVGAATILAGHAELRAELHTRKHRIGFLAPTTLVEYADRVEALREGLRRLGYVEGENLTIEQRWAEGKYERLPDLAAELVRSDVELILTWGTPSTRAALAATTKIPLVTIVVADLLSTGLIQSLARPGGNLTGQTFFFAEVCAKRVELIKEVMPALERVAILTNPANPSHAEALAAMKATAQALRLELLPVEASDRADLGRTFEVMNKEGTQPWSSSMTRF
jgi:putative tryptophan/tyrosine transport system substrate-binding protein